MYSDAFCKVYNLFGWNYFPEAFGEELVTWLERNAPATKTSLDLGCGTGILCGILREHGIAAQGADLSDGMIAVARRNYPEIPFTVANMITYRPEEHFDLVTCTGDALNHILDPADVLTIFRNVYTYLNKGGYFIFDILNEREVSPGEPIELPFSETVTAYFHITRDDVVHLKTSVYENGEFQFEEVITECVHDPAMIVGLLEQAGFRVLQCADKLLADSDRHGMTWYVIARK